MLQAKPMDIATTLRTNLMTLAVAYSNATKTTIGTVSKKFYGNVKFFEQFDSGRKSISIDKYRDVMGAIAKAWPTGKEWPRLRPVTLNRAALKKGKAVPKK